MSKQSSVVPPDQRDQGFKNLLQFSGLPADILHVPVTSSSVKAPSNARQQTLRCLDRLPPFSPILSRLLATLSRDDVSFAKMADLIEKDAVLSGNILALVNSASYGRRGRVNSVRHAVSLLGVAKLKNAALGMSITRMWNQVKTPPGWSMAAFNQHAIAAALLSDFLAQEAPVEYAEGAFIAGLLHDLGVMLLAVGQPDIYVEIDRQVEQLQRPRPECEMDLLGFTHAELSSEALRVWALPGEIQTAVRYHDCVDHDPTPRTENSLPLSYIVGAANDYATQMGIGVQTLGSANAESHRDVFERLGLESNLPRILDEFHGEFEASRSFF